MATITITQLYSILEQKLGRAEAEAITSFVDEKISETMDGVATKEFVRAEIQVVRTEIQQTKSDIIKWLVGLFITLALMIIGMSLKK